MCLPSPRALLLLQSGENFALQGWPKPFHALEAIRFAISIKNLRSCSSELPVEGDRTFLGRKRGDGERLEHAFRDLGPHFLQVEGM